MDFYGVELNSDNMDQLVNRPTVDVFHMARAAYHGELNSITLFPEEVRAIDFNFQVAVANMSIRGIAMACPTAQANIIMDLSEKAEANEGVNLEHDEAVNLFIIITFFDKVMQEMGVYGETE